MYESRFVIHRFFITSSPRRDNIHLHHLISMFNAGVEKFL
jgi:hypothetical protein